MPTRYFKPAVETGKKRNGSSACRPIFRIKNEDKLYNNQNVCFVRVFSCVCAVEMSCDGITIIIRTQYSLQRHRHGRNAFGADHSASSA